MNTSTRRGQNTFLASLGKLTAKKMNECARRSADSTPGTGLAPSDKLNIH